MIGQLDLDAGRGGRLDGGGYLGELGGTRALLRIGQALLRGPQLALGGARARGDVAAALQRARRRGGQVTGHLVQLVPARPPGSHRPRQRGGGGLGQVTGEAEPRPLRRVLIGQRLDRVAAALRLRPQPHDFRAHRVGAITVLHLDLEQGHVVAPDSDPDGGRVGCGRQAADHDGLESGGQVQVPVRTTRAPSRKTVTAVIGASSSVAMPRLLPVSASPPTLSAPAASHGLPGE